MKKIIFIIIALVLLSLIGAISCAEEAEPFDQSGVEMALTTHDGVKINVLDRGEWKHAVPENDDRRFDSEGVDLVLTALQGRYKVLDVRPISDYYGTFSVLFKVQEKD